MKLTLKIALSKKGTEYHALGVYNQRGYFVILTFEAETICRALGLSMRDLYTMAVGEYEY